MEKPLEPKYEDYGLTSKRFDKLENPIDLTEGYIFLIITLLFMGLGSFIYYRTNSILAAISLGFWFALGIYTLAIPIFVLPIEAIWKRTQKDYYNYRNYKKSLEHYRNSLVIWIKTQIDWWRSLSGQRFEIELGSLLTKQGWTALRTGKAGDEGVDLVLAKEQKTIIVQCKAHNKIIGPGAVRDLYGTFLHQKYQAQEAWLVSTHGFSKRAKLFALGKPIKLISIEKLI